MKITINCTSNYEEGDTSCPVCHGKDELIEDEHEVEVPSKFEVCSDCEGHGSVLNESMRGYAYSREEFEEEFSEDEDREAYFSRGGKYDVTCPTCGGKRVEEVVDESKATADQKAAIALWLEQEAQRARWDAEDAHTRRMESGGW